MAKNFKVLRDKMTPEQKRKSDELYAKKWELETLKWKKKRQVENEITEKTVTGNMSKAMSSTRSLFYHDIPPELIRRLANRYTGGHKKYSGNITMNLNWRSGLHDPFYCMDRLNHMIEHLMSFLEDGDTRDDNLGAIVWGCAYLMEVERLYPDTLAQVIGQMQLHGNRAAEMLETLKKVQNENS